MAEREMPERVWAAAHPDDEGLFLNWSRRERLGFTAYVRADLLTAAERERDGMAEDYQESARLLEKTASDLAQVRAEVAKLREAFDRLNESAAAAILWIDRKGSLESHSHNRKGTSCEECQTLNELHKAIVPALAAPSPQPVGGKEDT